MGFVSQQLILINHLFKLVYLLKIYLQGEMLGLLVRQDMNDR